MKERLSALMDGDGDEQVMGSVFERLRRDEALRGDWHTYCLIGDAIRGERAGAPDFVSRVMAEIEVEPTMIAPRAAAQSAARRGLWRAVMPLAASVMGVAAVGWVASALYSDSAAIVGAPAVAVAKSAPSALAVAGSGVAPVSTELRASAGDAHREYLFLHQAMAGGGPMPGAVQYVRTISDLRGDAGR